jgi:hypothetical protein
MNGARIVMALPGDPHTYSAATGLDLTAPSVHEYTINEFGGSAFRFWSEPHTPSNLQDVQLVHDDCTTKLSFTTDQFVDWKLNTTEHLIWAFNSADHFVGYHGLTKGHLYVTWASPALDSNLIIVIAFSSAAVFIVVCGLVSRYLVKRKLKNTKNDDKSNVVVVKEEKQVEMNQVE